MRPRYFGRDLKRERPVDYDADTFIYGMICGICMGVVLGLML